jgi:hypothetical protein
MVVYPFTCPNWIDLRVGVYFSVTTTSNGDDSTNSTILETIASSGHVPGDNYFIGLKANNSSLVGAGGTSNPAMGFGSYFSTQGAGNMVCGHQQGTNYWSAQGTSATSILWFDTTAIAGASASLNGLQMPAVAPATTGGYCVAGILRFSRPGGTGVQIYDASSSCNFKWTFTPTVAEIRSWLRSPPTTQPWRASGVAINTGASQVPDAFCAYWPFYNSRLRIHNVVIEKFA